MKFQYVSIFSVFVYVCVCVYVLVCAGKVEVGRGLYVCVLGGAGK